MPTTPDRPGSPGQLLYDLLADPGLAYRARWQRHAARTGRTGVNLAAVARVLAGQLVEEGGLDELEEPGWPRRHKNLLPRLLADEGWSPERLGLIGRAFALSDVHLRQLARLVDDLEVGPPVLGSTVARSWRTVAVEEEHVLGPDGTPQRHRTSQRLLSAADRLDVYPFRFDASTARVQVLRGGTAGPVRSAGGGLFEVLIALDNPIDAGQETDLDYETSFVWGSPPEPVFRRTGGRGGSALVRVAVRFHPHRLPARVLACYWPDLTAPPSLQEPVALDVDLTVAKTFTDVVGLVGFRWEWP